MPSTFGRKLKIGGLMGLVVLIGAGTVAIHPVVNGLAVSFAKAEERRRQWQYDGHNLDFWEQLHDRLPGMPGQPTSEQLRFIRNHEVARTCPDVASAAVFVQAAKELTPGPSLSSRTVLKLSLPQWELLCQQDAGSLCERLPLWFFDDDQKPHCEGCLSRLLPDVCVGRKWEHHPTLISGIEVSAVTPWCLALWGQHDNVDYVAGDHCDGSISFGYTEPLPDQHYNARHVVNVRITSDLDDRSHEIVSVWISKSQRSWGTALVNEYLWIIYTALAGLFLSGVGVLAILILIVRWFVAKSRRTSLAQ
jgi:hypothetical protein